MIPEIPNEIDLVGCEDLMRQRLQRLLWSQDDDVAARPLSSNRAGSDQVTTVLMATRAVGKR